MAFARVVFLIRFYEIVQTVSQSISSTKVIIKTGVYPTSWKKNYYHTYIQRGFEQSSLLPSNCFPEQTFTGFRKNCFQIYIQASTGQTVHHFGFRNGRS